jgi:hypothetical protein
MRNRFKLRVLGVIAVLTAWVAGQAASSFGACLSSKYRLPALPETISILAAFS